MNTMSMIIKVLETFKVSYFTTYVDDYKVIVLYTTTKVHKEVRSHNYLGMLVFDIHGKIENTIKINQAIYGRLITSVPVLIRKLEKYGLI